MFIFDEAHKLVIKDYADVLHSIHPLKIIARCDKLDTDFTIFSTATPIFGDYIDDKETVYMNNPVYFQK